MTDGRLVPLADEQLSFMREAVDLAAQSCPPADKTQIFVGALAVRDGEVIARGYKGMKSSPEFGNHAEYCMIKSLGPGARRLEGASVYTTLEPCTQASRSDGRISCSQWLIDEGVSEVFIGLWDPNPVVHRIGWKQLTDAGIQVRDFTPELREELTAMNGAFLEPWIETDGNLNPVMFDYTQNDGHYKIAGFDTQWGLCGKDAIYLRGAPESIAHARYATSFDQIDDPTNYEFLSHSYRLARGEIGILRQGDRVLLVRVDDVKSGAQYGDDHTSVTVSWQTRPSATG